MFPETGDYQLKLRPVVKGLLTFIPGVQKILPKGSTGGTNSADYCYGVWLKHLTLLWENGLRSIPNTIAELGPGDSLGIGLAAMLCGANNYYALDVKEFSHIETNLEIFDQLVSLFKSRAKRPTKGWPDFDEYLDANLFPSHILNEELLKESMSEKRISAIRYALKNPGSHNDGITIKYMVPWSNSNIIEKDTVDLILSHSVLEHVVDLETTYRALFLWLKPNGRMTHQIDFSSHGLSEKWNGYRAYSELLWKIINGKRTFLINRQPHSVHMDLIINNNFEMIFHLQNYRTDGIQRSALSDYWKKISDDDMGCSETFIQAKKIVREGSRI